MIYLFPLLSGILWAGSVLINKKNSGSNINPLNISIIYNISALLVSLVILLFTQKVFSNNIISYIYTALSSLFAVGGFIMYFKSMDITDISILSMLNRVSLIVLVIGGFLLFFENLSIIQIIGVVLVIAGIFSPGLSSLKYINSKGSLYALMSGLYFGISGLFDKVASKDFSASAYLVVGYIFALLFFYIIKYVGKVKKSSINKAQYVRIFFAGGLNSLAFFFLIATYAMGGGIAVSNLLSQVRLPLILFGGIVIYKEKEVNGLKIFGSILILLGTVFLQIK